MSGIALILNAVCFNSTLCQIPQPVPTVNEVEMLKGDLFYGDVKTTQLEKKKQLDKLVRDIKGKTLQITTLEDWPLSYVERDEKGTLLLKGRAMDFFDMLMKKYHFSYNLTLPKVNIYGSSNDSTGSILEMLVNKEVDMAVGFVPFMADMQRHIEFSKPLDEGEWRMIMRRPLESASGAGLLAPFDALVWYLILVALIVNGPVVFIIVWLYCKLAKNKDLEQPYYTLPQCIWYVYGGLMKQGSTLNPTADSIRIVFATWWMFITILTAFYTANLTAFLTLSRFTLPINFPEDLLAKRQQFIALKGSAVEYAIKNTEEELEYLLPMVDKNKGIFSSTNNDSDILMNEILLKNYVYIRDKPAIDHLVYWDWRKRKAFKSERLQCPFALSKESSLRRKRGFAYPLESKWRPLFDDELTRAIEGGLVQHRLKVNVSKAEICPQDLKSIERQLRLNDLATTYLTMLVGFSTGGVLFISEYIMRFFNKRKERLIREDIADRRAKRIQVQPKRPHRAPAKPSTFGKPKPKPQPAAANSVNKTVSPPPEYNEAIRTISNIRTDPEAGPSNVESYRTFNGRTYAVVKTDGGTQLVPMRAPSAAIFNYQYQQTGGY